MAPTWFSAQALNSSTVELRLESDDGLNRLTLELLQELAGAPRLHPAARRIVLTGNARHFSAGADLTAIAELDGARAWALKRFHGRYSPETGNCVRLFLGKSRIRPEGQRATPALKPL